MAAYILSGQVHIADLFFLHIWVKPELHNEKYQRITLKLNSKLLISLTFLFRELKDSGLIFWKQIVNHKGIQEKWKFILDRVLKM